MQYTKKYNIPYPELKDKANIPEDMKKMANSIDNGLDSIQKKIDDIIMSGDTNAEVVDARGEFDTLGNRLDNVDKNIVISTKPFETNCDIEDSANSKIKFDKIIGGLVQETSDGYNLFNVNDTKAVSSGITVDEEDWITITCDNSSGTSAIYQNYFTNNLNLKENTNYNIIAEIKKVSGTGSIQIVSSSSTSQFNQSIGYLFSDLSNGRTVQLNKLTKSDFTNTTQGIRTFCSFNAGESGSITFRISVLEDTTITSDNFVYVKFGKSPSLNYPSELKYVGGNYDIEVSNRNIWIPTLTNKGANIKAFNCTVELNDDIYKFTATDSDIYFGAVYTQSGINYNYTVGTLYKIKNHKTLSIFITNSELNKNYIEFYDKDKKTINYVYKDINNFKINIPTNAEYFVMRIGKGNAVSGTVYETKIDVRLDEDLINDYIKHEEQIYPVDLSNRNLLENKLNSGNLNGINYTINPDKSVTLNGTASNTTVIYLNDGFSYDIGTYRLSGCPSGGLGLYRLDLMVQETSVVEQGKIDIGNGAVFTLSQATNFIPRIRIQSGTTVNNIVFKPMLTKGTQELSYQPYVVPYNYSLYSENDYIYKKDNKLYVHNEWNKIILDGTINKFGGKSGTTNNNLLFTKPIENIKVPANNSTEVKIYSNYFKSTFVDNLFSNNIKGIAIRTSSEIAIGFGLDSGIDTLELANSKLQELYNAGTPVEIIYPLATPTETEIQGESAVVEAELLYKQLEALYNMKTYKGGTHITFDDIGKIQGEYIIDNGLAEAVREFNEINGYVDEARVIELINQYK